MKDTLSNPSSKLTHRTGGFFGGAVTDLIIAAGFVLASVVLLVVVDVRSPLLRGAVGVPLLFFIPGYVTVSIFLPRETTGYSAEIDTISGTVDARSVSDLERVGLAFGLSFALLPMLGLVIATTPWGFAETIVIAVVSGFSLTMAMLAIVRRLLVPTEERYRPRLGERIQGANAILFDTESTVHTAVNVVLVVSVVIALSTVGYALVAPQQGEAYTSLQLLTENESGDLVAAGYPEAVEPGESIPLVMTVQNEEGQDMNYTVVVQEQRLENGEVVERTELRTIRYVLSDGGIAHGERNITPEPEQGEVRISVQLYPEDEVPENPTHDNAYRYTYFWTEVSDGEIEGDDDMDGDNGGEG